MPYESETVEGLVRDGLPPENVWVGTTVEDQKRAEERVPALLDIPARVRFLSCEPLLERVILPIFEPTGELRVNPETGKREMALVPDPDHGLHWVICGGESGPGARPMEERWAHLLREQCRAAGVAFFMKQLGGVSDKRGEIEDFPADLQVREVPAVELR